MDLLAYIKDNPDVEHAPYGIEAVVAHTDLAKPGVIFILKNRNNAMNFDHKNMLHPFYMVYLGSEYQATAAFRGRHRLADMALQTWQGNRQRSCR